MAGHACTCSAVEAVPLPAGKRVELKPGGYHVMLVDLAQAARRGRQRAAHLHDRGQAAASARRSRCKRRREAARRDEARARGSRSAGRKARVAIPGTVNLPVTRASTVTFASLAEMEEVQRRFDADEVVPDLRPAQHAAARGLRGADGRARGRPSRGDACPRGSPRCAVALLSCAEGGRPRARHRQRLRPHAPLLPCARSRASASRPRSTIRSSARASRR